MFDYGAPDDLRYFNGGADRWARNGKMSLIQKQRWGSLVLTRHAERGPERQGETPEDFVAETVRDKRPGATDIDHAELVRHVRSWVATPEARGKLKLDAANEYRQERCTLLPASPPSLALSHHNLINSLRLDLVRGLNLTHFCCWFQTDLPLWAVRAPQLPSLSARR